MSRKSISAIWIAVLLIGAVLSGCVEKEPEVQDGIECTHHGNEIGYTQKKSGLKLVIEQTTGEYRVEYQGRPWLAGGQVRFYANGQWFTSNPEDNKTQPLTLMEIDEGKGSDRLGDYKSIKIKWQLSNRKKAPVDTLFYLYHDQPLITFEQTFSEAIPNTSVGDFEKAITAFPCFSTEKGILPSLRYITWSDIWHPLKQGKGLQTFTEELHVWHGPGKHRKPGPEGFPLVLYDEDLNALVLSPLNNFMIGVQSTKSEGNIFSCGLEGEIESIPKGFSYRTVLYAGKGINQALYEWGDTLLKWHGKKRTDPYADVGLSYLQYWTDNGAYYYYNTETGKNYEETLLDVKRYLDDLGVPVHSFQLDSWWYFKGKDSGVTLWEPKPDIFPNGIKAFQEKLELPLVMHNRYWSSWIDKKYLGNFSNLVVEKDGACPIDREFWDYLMGWAKNEGCEIYEQDWLNTQLQSVKALRSDPYLARDWLLNMGNAAEERGMSIQYCMPLPRYFLQSTEISSVTQIRVSDDYAVYFRGEESIPQWRIDQWKIGKRSMLAWAVGLWPFKDVFWTTSLQPDHSSKYKRAREPWPERQALVASLSGGPVAFGDGIGYTNKTLLMKTCREDGLLLKPDKPATPIDRTFTPYSPPAEVWETYSAKGGRRWHYLFIFDQKEDFELFPEDIGLKGHYIACNFQTGEVKRLPEGSSLLVEKNQETPWEYWVLVPIMENGMALIGDTSKFVCAANKRVSSVEVKGEKLIIHAEGAPHEKTSLTLFSLETPKAIKADGRPIARDGWKYNKENNTIRFEIQFDSRGERTIEVMK